MERGDDGRWVSATIGPIPGVGEGEGSDLLIAQVLLLTISRHDCMKSRSLSRISPGEGGPEMKSGWLGLAW